MNTPHDWLQLGLFLAALLLLTRPLGRYLVQVLDVDGRTALDRFVKPLERWTYRLCGVVPAREQSWQGYTGSLLIFTATGLLLTYAMLRGQAHLPLNPQGFPGMPPALALNTAVSFATNTDWQSYGGETTLSYGSQMVALTLHNFTSAAAGIAIAAALVRGLARTRAQTIGNFWVDVVRVTFYLLVPLSVLFALVLVSQGVIQNFSPSTPVVPIEAADAGATAIAQGPAASQVAIKLLGTNGGGFFNVNAAHPFENPTPLANFLQMLAIFAIPSALTWYLGQVVKNQRHGWTVWGAMAVLFVAGVLVCWQAEAAGNPLNQQLGLAVADGNLEGKEMRFGVFSSALFATVTTAASCGAVNAMHDAFTPLGGLVPLFNMQTGEVIFGGVGAGLYGMLMFVVLAVFIAGLMVGRTPEYLGKKIEAYEVKLVVLALIVLAATTLGLTAWASVSAWGVAGLNNAGPHGFTEIFYAATSAAANNGSAFAGLTTTPANGDPHWNLALALVMFAGRFLVIVPVLALAGSLAAKPLRPASAGTFKTEGPTFMVLLIGTVVLVGALTYLPGWVLGPVAEHYLMNAGVRF